MLPATIRVMQLTLVFRIGLTWSAHIYEVVVALVFVRSFIVLLLLLLLSALSNFIVGSVSAYGEMPSMTSLPAFRLAFAFFAAVFLFLDILCER